MLYERWMEIAAKNSGEIALMDVANDRRWTFGELRDAPLDRPSERVHVVRETSSAFIFELLSAWKYNVPACPLEPSQAALEIPELPGNCAHVKLTSGTTGTPLQIAFSTEQIFADALNIVSTMGLRPDWPNLGVISMAHSYGFSNLVTPLLLFGIPLILTGGSLPQTVAKSLPAACTLAAVPALWRAWHDAGIDLGPVKLGISAGAPLPLALETAVFENNGLKIHNFYGSSECGGIAFDRSTTPRDNPSLAGSALDNVHLSLSNEGALRVTSEAVAISYLPPLPVLGDGSFTTADLAEIRNGEVFLLGRLADTINVAGRKVSPEKIEQALLKISGIKSAVVFGAEAITRGEDIVACISGEFNLAEIKPRLAAELQLWEMPRQWYGMKEAPENERGKISRAQLRAQHKAGMPGFRLIS